MIRCHQKHHRVTSLCTLFGVGRSGYYDWKKRAVSQRASENQRIRTIIEDLRKNKKCMRTYGSPRMTVELRALGIACSENRVARIMRDYDIRAVQKKKFRTGTDARHDYPVAPNLLAQDFTTAYPDQVWLSDGTYIWTQEGWLVLAAVLDLHLRRCVGMAMGPRISSTLARQALLQAITSRRPKPGLIHHSDRGGEYAAGAYQAVLARHQMRASMSATGNCYDNAPMESFFATLKKELVYRQTYATRNEAALSIFHYIEGFYNTQRRHSSLGYLSPLEYEQKITESNQKSMQYSPNPPY